MKNKEEIELLQKDISIALSQVKANATKNKRLRNEIKLKNNIINELS